MGRVTMSEQLTTANATIERLVDEKNLLVVEANKRIQEAVDTGVNNVASTEAKYKDDIKCLNQEIELLTKKLSEKETSLSYAYKGREEVQMQINALQDILDVVPGVIPRKSEGDYNDKSVIVRFASILASKFATKE